MSWFYHTLNPSEVNEIFGDDAYEGDFIVHTRDSHRGVYALSVKGPNGVTNHLLTRRANGVFTVDGQSTRGSTCIIRVIDHLMQPGNGLAVPLERGVSKAGYPMGDRLLEDFDDSVQVHRGGHDSALSPDPQQTEERTSSFDVLIHKVPHKAFGLSFDPHPNGNSLILTMVQPGGLAYETGEIKPGMLLVSVNGESVEGMSKHSVASMLKSAIGDTLLGLAENPQAIKSTRTSTLPANDPFFSMNDNNISAIDAAWPAKRDLCGTITISGRTGFATFINGQYDAELSYSGGCPTYKHTNVINDDDEHSYGDNAGQSLYLFFHATNRCWVLSQHLESDNIIAYCAGAVPRPEQLVDVWHVVNDSGMFVPDRNVLCTQPRFAISKFRRAIRSLPGIEFAHELKDVEVAHIAAEISCPTTFIEKLRFDKCKLKLKSVKVICDAMTDNVSLTDLTICCDKVTDDIVREIAAASRLHKRLTLLSLRDNNIEDDGADALAHMLKVNSQIRGLRLNKNRITEKGALLLVNAITSNMSSNMQELVLSGNNIKENAKLKKVIKKLQSRKRPCVVQIKD